MTDKEKISALEEIIVKCYEKLDQVKVHPMAAIKKDGTVEQRTEYMNGWNHAIMHLIKEITQIFDTNTNVFIGGGSENSSKIVETYFRYR